METTNTPQQAAAQSPVQPVATRQTFDRGFITAITLKAEEERTEEEKDLLRAFNEQERRDREESARMEAERKRQSNALTAGYFNRIREDNSDKNLGWFINQAKGRAERFIPIRITNPQAVAQLPQMLTYAYRLEVERRGRTMIEDAYTAKTIADVCRWMSTHDKPGLMLRGYIGVGKTTMMYAMQTVFGIVEKKKIKIVDAQRVTNASRDSQAQFEEYVKAEMLGIDDLGTEPLDIKKYGNECSPMSELLTERYNKRLFTVITTNLTKEELQSTYGDRLYDRFREMYNSVSYDPEQKSYRQ